MCTYSIRDQSRFVTAGQLSKLKKSSIMAESVRNEKYNPL